MFLVKNSDLILQMRFNNKKEEKLPKLVINNNIKIVIIIKVVL